MPTRTEAKLPMITLGETVCEKLKTVYHSNQSWDDCYREVATKFTALKRRAKECFGQMTDIELLKHLQLYSSQDIEDMFHEEH